MQALTRGKRLFDMDTVTERKQKLLRRINEKARLLQEGRLFADSSLDAVFMIDTTGSMDPYISEVQNNILRITDEVMEFSPRVRMGCIAFKDHGDEGEDEFYLTKILPLTFDRKEIVEFVRSPDLYIGEGGGGPEAVECALHEAAGFNWNETSSPKAVILIGDKPPHGVMDSFNACMKSYDFKREVDIIAKKGIRIYPILCNSVSETESTFRWMAGRTGGRFFYLEDISDLSDLLTGICLKETGKISFFEKKLLEYGDMTGTKRALLLGLRGSQKIG